MSSNFIDFAVIDAYIRDHFQDGSTYGSTVEKQRDFAHPAYKLSNATGELFRELVGQKITRTLQSGRTFGNTRVIDPNGNHVTAGATKNADGSIDAGVTQYDAPNGTLNPSAATAGTPTRLPMLQQLPGGTQQVTIRRGDAVPKDPTRPAPKMGVTKLNDK